MARLAACALALVVGATPAVADSYLCVGEASGGVRWDGAQWVGASFSTANDQYVVSIVRQTGDTSGGDEAVEVKPIGLSTSIFTACSHYKDYPVVLCSEGLFSFAMNTGTLRFTFLYGLGYIDGEDAGSDTPEVVVGRCSPI